jgi:hypothetical protein
MQREILGRNAERDQGIRTRNLATATPLKRTSVTDGHTEFNGNESLLVKGSQLVSGWLIITGTLKGVGTLIWEQAVRFSGVFTMTGPTNLDGDTKVTKTLDVSAETILRGATNIKNTLDVEAATRLRGETTVEKNLTVKTGGKIVVEAAQSITLSSARGTAMLEFSDGPRMWSQSGAARMDAGPGTSMVITTTDAAILRSPDTAKAVAVSDTGTRIFGDVFLPNLPTKSGVTANVFADPDGKLSIA